MPTGPAATLSKIDAEILKMLWASVFLAGGVGASIAEIEDGLGKCGITRCRSDLQRHHINPMIRAGLIAMAGKAQTNSRGGDKPNVYCVNRFTTLTWTSTAYMLVEVKKRQQVAQGILVDRLIKAKIIDSATKELVTPESLSEQINTSIQWNYMSYINKNVLWPLPRTDFELEYLKFVASYVTLVEGS